MSFSEELSDADINFKKVFIYGGVVALLVALLGSFVTIGPGSRGVLMTFGAVNNGVLSPGLHVKLPLIQSVARMNVQVQKSQAEETAASLDLQNVKTTVATNWNLQPDDVEWVYQHIGTESQITSKIIEPSISNAVKAVTAHYNAEELVEKRDQVRQEIEKDVKAAVAPYRVILDSLNITDFSFSPEYEQAIEAKQVAQQQAQQAQYELQRAQVDAQRQVATAQGQSQAQKLLQQTLTPLIIQQEAIQKWNGALPAYMGSGSVPFVKIGDK